MCPAEKIGVLDAERRAEAEVWLALTGRALVDPALRAQREEAHELLQDLCRRMIYALVERGEAFPRLDIDLEAERLYALVDGLALHAVVRPEEATANVVKAALACHLDELCQRTRSVARRTR